MPEIEIIEIEPLTNLSMLEPEINFKKTQLSFANNVWGYHEKDNDILFLDRFNHSILRFGNDFKFKSQIGGDEKEKIGLFFPNGIFIDNNIFYVLDNEGKTVKMFSPDGKFISGFDIIDAYSTEAILLHNGNIFLSVKYKNVGDYNSRGLISVFSRDGKKKKEFGKVIPCESFQAFTMFNRVRFCMQDNILYMSHNFLPILKKYDMNGQELMTINLADMNIPEILQIEAEGYEKGVDTPDCVKEEDRASGMRYCYGFIVDNKHNIFYGVNFDRAAKGIVFKLDEDGRLLKKVIFTFENKRLRIRDLYFRDNNRYCIGEEGDNLYVFTFQI